MLSDDISVFPDICAATCATARGRSRRQVPERVCVRARAALAASVFRIFRIFRSLRNRLDRRVCAQARLVRARLRAEPTLAGRRGFASARATAQARLVRARLRAEPRWPTSSAARATAQARAPDAASRGTDARWPARLRQRAVHRAGASSSGATSRGTDAHWPVRLPQRARNRAGASSSGAASRGTDARWSARFRAEPTLAGRARLPQRARNRAGASCSLAGASSAVRAQPAVRRAGASSSGARNRRATRSEIPAHHNVRPQKYFGRTLVLRPSFDRIRGPISPLLAGRTGLEPAASGVTGRRYNRLNYRPRSKKKVSASFAAAAG